MLLLLDDSATAIHAYNADIAQQKPQPPHQASLDGFDDTDSEFDDLDSTLDDFFVDRS